LDVSPSAYILRLALGLAFNHMRERNKEMSNQISEPGQAWMSIIGRSSEEDFAKAFATEAKLEASVLAEPLTGASAIRRFFTATRGMYDRIAFIGETKADKATYLEWAGQFHGKPVAGMTVLIFNEGGLIETVRLYHRPYHQVIEFAGELTSRLST
jgi:hypothetical protein